MKRSLDDIIREAIDDIANGENIQTDKPVNNIKVLKTGKDKVKLKIVC